MPTEKELDGMTAAQLLTEVAGYTQLDAEGHKAYQPGRASSERWVEAEGGFECYTPVSAGFGGEPWGKVLSPALMQVPWRTKDEVELADGSKVPPPNGVHPATHPGAFEWVWPEAEVWKIYRYASRQGADSPQYVKVTAEDGTESIVPAK